MTSSSRSSGTVIFTVNPLRDVRKVFRKMRYIQARKFVPCWNETKPFSALRYVSCTRSSASSRLCVSQCAKLYNEASIGIASISKDSASLGRFVTTQYGNSSPGPAESHSPGVDSGRHVIQNVLQTTN